MDFFNRLLEQVKNLWGKWTMVQKLILFGIAAVVVIGFIAMVSVSTSPSMVAVIDAPILDEETRNLITTRINEEGYKTSVAANGVVMVEDKNIAKKMRGILIREDLIPKGTDPWKIFDRERWTLTDIERNVNLQRAIKEMVVDHIKALDGVDDAKVSIVFPKDSLFTEDQNPVTASVTLVPRPGSDITENRKKIEGIQKILKHAIEGLKDEGITITDKSGLVLNDFENLKGFDEQTLVERQQKYIRTVENDYRKKILSSLQSTYTLDRVRDLDVKFEIDMSKQSVSTTRALPFILKERTPNLAYDDSERKESAVLSEEDYRTKYKGTAFNPEGPPGVEANVMPSAVDVANMHGEVTQDTKKTNYLVGSETIEKEQKPKTERLTVSVNIDGTWQMKYDEKGKPIVLPNKTLEREYTPVDEAVLVKTQKLVQDAIGYNPVRSDSVTVLNIPYDRTAEFAEKDAAYFREQNIQRTIIFFLVGLAVLLIAFVIFRLVSKAIERQRLAAEEALARERQAARERALLEAEQEGVEVSMSVEERKRMELQENVISMAKDHPEDAAQLIRTWLLED
jgi:flagellar M-ring protein FliF